MRGESVGDIFPRQMKKYEGEHMQSRGMVHVQSCKENDTIGELQRVFRSVLLSKVQCRETGRSWSKNVLTRAKPLPETSEGFRRRQHDKLHVLENLL